MKATSELNTIDNLDLAMRWIVRARCSPLTLIQEATETHHLEATTRVLQAKVLAEISLVISMRDGAILRMREATPEATDPATTTKNTTWLVRAEIMK